jgi:hypothetical protein
LLVVETIRRLGLGSSQAVTNDWRISPWHSPFGKKRWARPPLVRCECCGRPELRAFAERLWGGPKSKKLATIVG